MKLIAVKFCFRIMFINEKSNQYIRMIKYQVFVILAIKYEWHVARTSATDEAHANVKLSTQKTSTT